MNELEKLIKDVREKNLKGQAFGAILGKINKDKNLSDQLKENTSFLETIYKDISPSQRFYHIWFNIGLEICSYCGDPKKFTFNNKFSINQYDKKDANYCGTCTKDICSRKYNTEKGIKRLEEKHGTKNIWEIPGYREKLENSNLKKYGSKYYTETQEFKDKSQKSIEKNWEGKHPTKHKSVQDKKKDTCLEKYGTDCLLKNRDLMKEGMIKKYGVEYNMQDTGHKQNHKIIMEKRHGGIFLQSEEIRNKIGITNIIKYGFIYPTQNEDISEKQSRNSKKFKDYTFPSGKSIKIQGYENLALDILLQFYQEDDIITGRKDISDICGKFNYIYNGKNKRYFPDIYLKSKNLIIEVKSEYTFNQDIEINILKKNSILKNNIEFKYMVFNNNKNFLGYY